jgi:hypothetical protein
MFFLTERHKGLIIEVWSHTIRHGFGCIVLPTKSKTSFNQILAQGTTKIEPKFTITSFVRAIQRSEAYYDLGNTTSDPYLSRWQE